MPEIGKVIYKVMEAPVKAAYPLFPKDGVVKSRAANGAIKWFGGLNTMHNRLILGVTGIAIQPFIDLNNKKVDEKTRKVSVARTVAKILVGTATGVAVRGACIELLGKKCSQLGLKEAKGFYGKLKTLFVPNVPEIKNLTKPNQAYRDYQNAIGTFLGLIAMCITNFAIDMPLTKFFTNILIKKSAEKAAKSEGGK